MRIKVFLCAFVAMGFISCNQNSVLYKENSYPVSDKNRAKVCKELAYNFPDYSCEGRLNQPKEIKAEPELVKIEMSLNKVTVSYETTGKNQQLFEQFKELIEDLESL